MKILTLITGEYGERHLSNIKKHAPSEWIINYWKTPNVFPLIMDYPEEYLPENLPDADLILSFGEHRGVAELIPPIVEMTGAKAVIAAIDNEAWLPRGLARQLHGWLEKIDVACATPKPLCSLTENDYMVSRSKMQNYDSPFISEFAQYFGQPRINLSIDPDTNIIISASISRDAVCGCARYVVENIVGNSVMEAEEKAGLLHHHYPCLAAMGIDSDFGDTLMHISGNILKHQISTQIKPYKNVPYITPGKRSD